MTLIKVCGLRRPQDAEVLNELRPDMAGLVFYPPSRRFVTRREAESIGSLLDPSIVRVGVFVDEDPRVVADLVESGIIDAIQLHGSEDEAYIRGLRGMTDAPVIKAFVVSSDTGISAAVSSSADMVLLDADKGSGRTFDWSILEEMDREYILSGGLDPSNVGKAVSSLHPMGVDVSSGVETGGFKDRDKMRAFVESVRRARRCCRTATRRRTAVSAS